MARLFQSGAEIDGGVGTAARNVGPDGGPFTTSNTSTLTRDTVVFNSGGGVASWKFTPDTGAGTAILPMPAPTYVDGHTYWARCYFRMASAPNGDLKQCPLSFGTGGLEIGADIAANGKVFLMLGAATQGSGSAASVCDGNWHRIELKAVAAATTVWSAGELVVDGTTVASFSGASTTRTNGLQIGRCSGGGDSLTTPFNVDDVALNDSTGASNNGYPGAGAVVLLKPTADSAVGTGWVTGAGGSTSLFDAVNNTPPVGVVDTGTATSQIRNATSNATSYDATMTTYTAAGVTAGSTVNSVLPVTATAAPVTTSAKQGTVGVVSNPAITNVALNATGTAGAFWAGLAAGTFGAGWKWSLGTMTESPTVTLGTAPVMRITNSTASTRIADVCAMFMYVDYTPPVVAAGVGRANTFEAIPFVPLARGA